jgi:ribosomal-protein-alanine N-acetyltransferase
MHRLDGGVVFLRAPEMRDYQAWADLREASRVFLAPWEPTWSEDELSRASYKYRLRRYAEDVRDGRAYAFFTFRKSDAVLVGGVTLSRIQRGVAQMGTIGYWAGAAFAGQGFTSAATRAVVRFAFEELDLHRVEAACQPDNEASLRLLQRVGFQREGFARSYLKIDGQWRDHVLFGFVRGDPLA